ncbi:MAG: ABC transporter ATP-binding protein [bacterium]|nr:ABC transporter ATP-binding protein [bacterium]
MSNERIILETRGARKEYISSYNQKCLALDRVNLKIYANEILCIIGESGSGKSTLLNVLGGLTRPSNGEVFFFDHRLHELKDEELARIRNQNFGFIFQFHNLLPEFTVLENLLMPLMLTKDKKCFGSITEKARVLLRKLGIIEKINNFPKELSGGESQRVAIARALINEPDIIFADEPTGNLDAKNRERIYDILEEVNENFSSSIVIVTHDKDIKLKDYKTKTICLKDGQVI